MDDALLFQEPLAIAQLILLILVLGTLSLLAIRYLLSQPRKRPYRNVLLAALICRLPLDVLVVWVQFMQEDDLPSPFQFLGLPYILLHIVILYVAGRYRKTMSREEGRPYIYMGIIYWFTLGLLALLGLILLGVLLIDHALQSGYMMEPY